MQRSEESHTQAVDVLGDGPRQAVLNDALDVREVHTARQDVRCEAQHLQHRGRATGERAMGHK